MTGIIRLPVGSLFQSDGPFPIISIQTSSDADSPKVRALIAAFDDTTAQTVCFDFPIPANYASGGTMKISYFMASATSGGVAFRAALQAVTPSDSTAMPSLDPVNAGGGWATGTGTVPGTAGYLGTISITLNMNSAAPGDSVEGFLQRNPADSGDTATGNAIIEKIWIEYTTV